MIKVFGFNETKGLLPFANQLASAPGRILAVAFQYAGVETARIVGVGEKMPASDFAHHYLPHIVPNSSYIIDIGVDEISCDARVSNIVLLIDD